MASSFVPSFPWVSRNHGPCLRHLAGLPGSPHILSVTMNPPECSDRWCAYQISCFHPRACLTLPPILRSTEPIKLLPQIPLSFNQTRSGVSGPFGFQVSDCGPNPFERSFKCFLLINLRRAEDKRFQLFEPEGRVLESSEASLRFIKKPLGKAKRIWALC